MQETQQFSFQYVNAEGELVQSSQFDHLAILIAFPVILCLIAKLFKN